MIVLKIKIVCEWTLVLLVLLPISWGSVAGITLIFIDLFSESQYLSLHLSLQYSSVVLYP